MLVFHKSFLLVGLFLYDSLSNTAMDVLLEPIIETGKETFCVEIMKRLDCQRRNEHLCDVTLEVGSGEDQAFLKAHRSVLCAASPFFYNAFNTDMKEKEEGVIRLKDTNKVLMEQVLEFLYTGHVDINVNNAFDLMSIADYFLITGLKYLSSKFIQETFCVSNCIMAYYSSVKYHCSELQEAARRFIFANFMHVARTEDFLSLSAEEVEEWISSNEVVIKDEEEIFRVILRWTEKAVNRKQSFCTLFRHLRCLYIPLNYLVTVILQHELVKNEKKCMDSVLNAMREFSDGTDACFFKQSPRSCLRTQEEVIFGFGGEDGNKLVCYQPSENKWYQMPGLQSCRNRFSLATAVCKSKLYVVGGSAAEFTVERYDPVVNTWSPIKSFKQKIKFPAAVTFQGCLYVIGGLDMDDEPLNTVQRYNPDTDFWQEVAPLSCGPRSRVGVVSDGSYIYAVGGMNSFDILNTVEKFDPKMSSWSAVAPMQAQRKHPCCVNLNGRIFVFGGVYDETGGCPCEVYDKEANIWTEISNNFAPRFPASALHFKEQIFVFGGFGVDQSFFQEMILQVYDVEANEWKPCSNASLGSWLYKLSAGRISRELLNSCESISVL